MADLANLGLQRTSLEFLERERDEELDAVLEVAERRAEGALTFDRGAQNVARIFDPPMGGDGMAGPDRAGLAGRVVADGEHGRQ